MCFSALVRKNVSDIEFFLNATKSKIMWDVLYQKSSECPKDFKVAKNGQRFFCGDKYYIPVYWKCDNKVVCEPMRYGKYYEPSLRKINRGNRHEKRCNYNSRLDNIKSPAWSDAYRKGHGFVALDGFFENVLVKDLISSGIISLKEVEEYFSHISLMRKKRILAQGKPYAPTKTELKDPKTRHIVIEFKPNNDIGLYVPVIFNKDSWDGNPFKGFSMITTDPSPEIAAAGHDRSPVILAKDDLLEWLSSAQYSHEDNLKILNNQVRYLFRPSLDSYAS